MQQKPRPQSYQDPNRAPTALRIQPTNNATPRNITYDLNVPSNIRHRFERRPSVHIVVLFATDSRVIRYAKDLQNTIADSGLDSYLQSKMDNSLHFIKADNLAEIINGSKMDFLIVIGDRNMKNKSCQGKKKGKLIEMKLEEMIQYIWTEWSTMSKIEGLEEFFEEEYDNIPEDKFEILMDKYFGLRHLRDRLDKIEIEMKELSEMRAPKNEYYSSYSRADGGSIGGGYTSNERTAAKLTQVQKLVVRLHQQLFEAIETSQDIPVENQKTMENSGKGAVLSSSDVPAPLKPGISTHLRDRLIGEIEGLLDRVDAQGEILSNYGSPLWTAYAQEYQKKAENVPRMAPAVQNSNGALIHSNGVATTSVSAPTTSGTPMPPHSSSWDCGACTYSNENDAPVCEICQNPKPKEVTTDWNLTGAAGKKQRKQQREKEKISTEAEEIKFKEKQRVDPLKSQNPNKRLEENRAPIKKTQSNGATSTSSGSVPSNFNGQQQGANQWRTGSENSTFSQQEALKKTQPTSYASAGLQQQQFIAAQQQQYQQQQYLYQPQMQSRFDLAQQLQQLQIQQPQNRTNPASTSFPFTNHQQQMDQHSLLQHQLRQQQQQQLQLQILQAQASQLTSGTPTVSSDTQNASFSTGNAATQQNYLNPRLWSDGGKTGSLFPSTTTTTTSNTSAFPSFGLTTDTQQTFTNNWSNAFASFSGPSPFGSSSTGSSVGSTFNNGTFSVNQPQTQQTASETTDQSDSGESEPDFEEKEHFEWERQKAVEEVKKKLEGRQPLRPCCYCGDESFLECNHCAKLRLGTYFCSPEHQSLMWKEHLEFHKQQYYSSIYQYQRNQ